MNRINVYVRMRHRVKAEKGTTLTIGDVAFVKSSTDEEKITALPLYTIQPSDDTTVIIDVMNVIDTIHRFYKEVDVQTVGPTETIVSVLQKKKRLTPVFFVLIWILLFIGAGLAIMNFHVDVSMNEVHRRIYYFVTGQETTKPLILQVPYSIGLGVGMILFFNHFFKKRFSDEPSPLEIEMFQYQESLDRYIVRHDHPFEKDDGTY